MEGIKAANTSISEINIVIISKYQHENRDKLYKQILTFIKILNMYYDYKVHF